MICVTLARTRHKMMIAEYKAASQQGADLVELRLDYLRRAPNLRRIIEDKGAPVIVSYRRPQDGGRFRGKEEDRMLVIRSAIADGVDYVDLEVDIAKNVPRFGNTKRIISYHNFTTTPQNLVEIYNSIKALDPDIIKIVTMAERTSDSLRMLKLVKDATIPTVGFCMGDLGTASRILCLKFGSPFTYAAFNSERTVAPGQLSWSQIQEEYRGARVDADTAIYGVVGDPIAHSLSPLVHNRTLEQEELNAIYLPFRVPAGKVGDFMKEAVELGVKGLSVTIPHKEAALRHVKQADGATQMVGALNTLVRRGKEWEAHNTDYRAAMDSVEFSMGGERGEASPMTGKQVLILGAGGASRALAHGLVRRGALVSVTNRTEERGERLAKEAECRYIPWGQRMSNLCDILINCTPIGMYPEVDQIPIPGNCLREGMLVFDTIYHPETTLLIKEARVRGCRVITGVEMFVRQAAEQFRIFTGLDADEQSMSDAIRQHLSPTG